MAYSSLKWPGKACIEDNKACIVPGFLNGHMVKNHPIEIEAVWTVYTERLIINTFISVLAHVQF